MSPECLASLIICEEMDDHEAILLLGTERMASYTGYASSFQFAGDFRDPALDSGLDQHNRLRTAVCSLSVSLSLSPHSLSFSILSPTSLHHLSPSPLSPTSLPHLSPPPLSFHPFPPTHTHTTAYRSLPSMLSI